MNENEFGSWSTSRTDFERLVAEGRRVIPVVRRLFADSLSPMDIYASLAAQNPGSFLLESADPGGLWSRYSFVGVTSFGILTADDDARPSWIDLGLDESEAFGPAGVPDKNLDALGALHDRWASLRVPGLPPLTGGLIGYIGWEAVRELESLPDAPPADYSMPLQSFNFVADLVAIDHKTGTIALIANVLPHGHSTASAWSDAQDRLDRLVRKLALPITPSIDEVDFSVAPQASHRTPHADYLASVEKAKAYIRIGDIFQVVIGQRFDLDSTSSPIDTYRVLRAMNPSPYMYLLNMVGADGAEFSVVGSSPEALVKVSGDRVVTHPIAGSRPRGASPDEDTRLAAELLSDAKERAEHLMLVDLARNDLLKVSNPDSVEVVEFMKIEQFSHIMHLVSTVVGTLEAQVTPIDVFRATFPAGTLSGAPKPRALEIIDELEPAQRGIYGGVVGYFDFAGDLDLAIAIRTAVMKDGVAHVSAGAGLVADSDPQTEYEESQNKAAAPLRAVAAAEGMHPATIGQDARAKI